MSDLQALLGKTIRGYKIEQLIGKGGWGAVYLAYQQTVNRYVAMKMILPEYANQPDFAKRFQIEAQLVAQLQHPHILPLFDYWRDDEGAYYVMRYVTGGSLHDYLKEHGAMPLEDISKLLNQVCDALSVAHGTNVVHRDLKPANILRDERGNAYLADFGIAKRKDSNSQMTQAGNIMGTPAYISPEQLKGQEVTPRSDIYAMGIMLWELMAGSHPFAGDTVAQMMVRHMAEPLPSIQTANEAVPLAFDHVIQRATAKESDDRYADVLAMANDFRQVLSRLNQPPRESEPIEPVVTRNISPSGDTPLTQMQTVIPDDPHRSYLNALRQQIDNYLNRAVISAVPGTQIVNLEATNNPSAVAEQQRVSGSALPMAFFDMAGISNDDDDEAGKVYTAFEEAFDAHDGRLLLLGEPGAGKTVTLMAMARTAIDRRLLDPSQPLPILAPIATWNMEKRQQFDEWLGQVVPVLKNDIKDLMAHGKLMLLLDGLDELGGERDDPLTHKRFDPRLRFIEMLPDNNHVLLSCRVFDYEEIGTKIPLAGSVVLRPLTDEQIQTYLSNLPDLWLALRQDDELREMARNPLLLSLFTYAYAGLGEQARQLKDLNSGDLRDMIFTTYVQRRYQHEARKPNVRLPFNLQELYKVVGKVAMWDAGKMAGTKNILSTWYFEQVVGDAQAAEFVEMGNQLHILRGSGTHVRFIHLLVRDYFAYQYSIDNLDNANEYALSIAATNPAHTLGMLGDMRALKPMMDLLSKESTHNDIKSGLIWALGKIGDSRAFDLLRNVVLDSEAPVDHRMSATYSLGQLGNPEALGILLDVLTDKNENVLVRSSAGFSLGHLKDEHAVPALLQTLYDEERSLRDGAVDALGEIGDNRALLPLMDMLDDQNPSVRGRAARALGQIGDRRAVSSLVELLADIEMPPIMWSGMPKRICDIAAEALTDIGTADALAEANNFYRKNA